MKVVIVHIVVKHTCAGAALITSDIEVSSDTAAHPRRRYLHNSEKVVERLGFRSPLTRHP